MNTSWSCFGEVSNQNRLVAPVIMLSQMLAHGGCQIIRQRNKVEPRKVTFVLWMKAFFV